MSQPTEQRPPQVTLASGIVMFASILVLLTAWESVSALGSLETQDAIRTALAEAPFTSLGLDVQSATGVLRVVMMVAAASACATAILGWYVRKPDRSARLALTIFAVPVFLSGMTVGGLAGSFVAAGAAMLWLAPGREWFATGRWTPPAPRPEPSVRESALRRTPPPASPPPPQGPAGQLPPPPSGSAYGSPPSPPPSWQQAQHQQLHARPAAMVAAFVITVVMAGGLLTMSLLWVAVAGLSPDFLRSVLEEQPELVDQGLTFDQVRDTVLAFAGAFIVWCVVALVLAGFAMARRDWARRGLMVIAAFSAVGCMFFVLESPLVVFPAMAGVATVICLRRVEVRRWFALESR
ncbi:hypothetical protein EUA06_04295 [Nocardioides glacieisoli]|uniref:Uncharacterized protein n=1 Tax=Nocardioides glacieisoli TaxID=1168730 RepID=A0A4Q2RX78_9ACTN|nr:hypothetical protein [Nocardioides glacieisoli]RYB92203.1 hypothetical protein EUA06_04295 [Nocardioides glacieisoli]